MRTLIITALIAAVLFLSVLPSASGADASYAFEEEGKLQNAFKLDEVLPDIQNAQYRYYGNENIGVKINLDSSVDFESKKENWNGQEEITFAAFNDTGHSQEYTVLVTVTPVDDLPKLTNTRLTPGSGTPDTDFAFTVTYTDADNDPPDKIQLMVDETPFDLLEVNPNDTDYADGKDYKLVTKLDEGTHVIYFRCTSQGAPDQEVTTTAGTVPIGPATAFQYHIDIAIVLAILIIPSFYIVVIFRRISRSIERIEKAYGKEERKEEKKEE